MPDKAQNVEVPGLNDLVKVLKPDNFSLDKFEDVFYYFFKNSGSAGASPQQIGQLAPKLSIKQNLELIKKEIGATFPGYNTEFPVDGLEEGKAGWLVEAHDRKPEDPVILFAHGGGYVLGLLPSFVYLFVEVYKRLANKRLSVLLINYTLSVDSPHPQQLIEYAKVYNQLAKSCKNIIAAGDSAGGHLSMTFMRHQNFKPYEGVLEADPQRASGAILTSPWVHLYPKDAVGSYKENLGKDVLSSPAICAFCTALLPDGDYDRADLNPSFDKIEWRKIIPQNILLTKGGSEVLRDDINRWANIALLEEDEIFENPNSVHDDGTFWPRTSAITEKIVEYMRWLGKDAV